MRTRRGLPPSYLALCVRCGHRANRHLWRPGDPPAEHACPCGCIMRPADPVEWLSKTEAAERGLV